MFISCHVNYDIVFASISTIILCTEIVYLPHVCYYVLHGIARSSYVSSYRCHQARTFAYEIDLSSQQAVQGNSTEKQ